MTVLNNISENEVLSIIGGRDDQEPIRYRWECKLVSDAGEVVAHKTDSVYYFRDYLANFTDEVRVNVFVSPGEFEKTIFPYRNNFEAVITRVPVMVDPAGLQVFDRARSEVKRYRAIMEDVRSQRMEGRHQSDGSYEAMDLKELRPITLTLMEKGIEQIRTITCAASFRNTTPANLLRFLFTKVSRQLQVDQSDAIQGVDVVEDVALTTPIQQIVIPPKVLFKDVARFIQTGHGVYNTGINRYLQNRIWYVYPTYETKRFATATRKMTILNLPDNMMKDFKKTCRYVDGHLYLISTEDTTSRDMSNLRQLNEGNGMRYLNASRLFNGMVETGDNKAKLDRRNNMAEYISEQRDTGINFAPMGDQPVTSSHAHQLSKMAARQGMLIQAGWESSEPWYVTPGMPVRYLSPVNGILKERYGSIIGIETNVFSSTQGVVNSSHTSKSALTLFLEPAGEI